MGPFVATVATFDLTKYELPSMALGYLNLPGGPFPRLVGISANSYTEKILAI